MRVNFARSLVPSVLFSRSPDSEANDRRVEEDDWFICLGFLYRGLLPLLLLSQPERPQQEVRLTSA